MHAEVIAVFLLFTASLVLLRRRWRGTPRAETLDRVLGVGGLVAWFIYKAYVLLPGVRELEYSLPLQFCDISGVVAPLALLTCRRCLRAILYFWGIGLSSLAFIVPDLHEGPDSGRFWLFWLSHTAIVGSAFYDVAGRGFRPDWRDWLTAVAAAAAYVIIVLPFDVVTGFNYAYVGPSRANQPPILDALGAWPGRLALQSGLVILELFLLFLPWEIARRVRETRASRDLSNKVALPLVEGNRRI